MTQTNGSGWAGLMGTYGVSENTTARLVRSLAASEVAGLAFCRLLERWQRGEPDPCTPERRQAAFRRAAERAETALTGLERPLGRFRYGEPGAGEVVEWDAVLKRAGVVAAPHRVAHAYLELAVLVRALQGLADSARIESAPGRDALWAGLFDLRENLLDGCLDDLRALAA
jgi:hypothetical protein